MTTHNIAGNNDFLVHVLDEVEICPKKYLWIVALTRFATAVVQPHILAATILLVKKTREGCPAQLLWDLHFALLYDKGRTDNA